MTTRQPPTSRNTETPSRRGNSNAAPSEHRDDNFHARLYDDTRKHPHHDAWPSSDLLKRSSKTTEKYSNIKPQLRNKMIVNTLKIASAATGVYIQRIDARELCTLKKHYVRSGLKDGTIEDVIFPFLNNYEGKSTSADEAEEDEAEEDEGEGEDEDDLKLKFPLTNDPVFRVLFDPNLHFGVHPDNMDFRDSINEIIKSYQDYKNVPRKSTGFVLLAWRPALTNQQNDTPTCVGIATVPVFDDSLHTDAMSNFSTAETREYSKEQIKSTTKDKSILYLDCLFSFGKGVGRLLCKYVYLRANIARFDGMIAFPYIHYGYDITNSTESKAVKILQSIGFKKLYDFVTNNSDVKLSMVYKPTGELEGIVDQFTKLCMRPAINDQLKLVWRCPEI